MIRTFRVGTLVLAIALTTQLAGACTFRSALGNMVVTSAATESAAAVAAPAAEVAPPSRQDGDEFKWRGQLAAGRVIEVKGVNGGVSAEGTSGGEVEVVATKRARRSDTGSVRIEVVPHADGVTVCAVYPSPNANKPNVCAPGDGGHMSVNNNDVQVDFIVRVPAGVRFSGHTVNGGVEAKNIQANVEATTVNGGIEVSTLGYARASTVNGGIRATMGRADWQNDLEFETVNGSIELSMPSGLSADLRAETLNGHISNDFPLSGQNRVSRRKLEGAIGGGGRVLRLKTVNGNVEIQRGS